MKEKIQFGNFINGVWIEKSDEKPVEILNKYSGEVLAKVTMANDEIL